MQLIWQAKGTAYIGANLPIYSGNIVYFSKFKFKIVFSLTYILIILTLTRKRFDIVLACASCFNSQMGCSSGYVESALGPLPPGLVRSATVAHNSSTTPADLLGLLSVPLCSLLRLQLSPVKSLKGVRFSHCTPVISISNPPRLCLGSHH